MGKLEKRKRIAYTQEQRELILNDYVESGLTRAEFCRQRGITPQTLSTWLSRDKKQRGRAGYQRGPYRPEQRIQAVEAFLAADLVIEDFCKTWGVSKTSFNRWLQIYRDEGPKGLEGYRQYKPVDRRKGCRLPRAIQKQIIALKISDPAMGFKKIRDFLYRLKGIKTSVGTIRKILYEEGLDPAPRPQKRKKPIQKVRRFERAKAQQLWQTDITSYLLTRHSTRVYLTVFLDDYSRYVVAWSLATRQTSDFVCEALLDGISHFGKPEEVLTDQGRQYFAWRGKVQFQKLLAREGIKHVVSRSHHPQTLGKCERLWDTVGREFWDRAKPQELTDARNRLKLYFDHYNHFRPHQGLDGLTPADRYFGVASEVRKALEDTIESNSLRMSLDEPPRSPVFLVGQIGDKRVALHGEDGHLVMKHPHDPEQELSYDYQAPGRSAEQKGGDGPSDGRGAESPQQGGETDQDQWAPAGSSGKSEEEVPSNPSEGPMGHGTTRGERESSQKGFNYVGVLGRKNPEGSSSQSPGGESTEVLATQPTSDGRDGGGPSYSTSASEESDGSANGRQGQSEETPETDQRAGEDRRDAEQTDRDTSINAWMPGYGTELDQGEEE